MQSKSAAELEAALPEDAAPEDCDRLRAMLELHGDGTILDVAARRLAGAPAAVAEALDRLNEVAKRMRDVDGIEMYFDLGEMRGWRYHTGVVFAIYVEGFGEALALGGRCDGIGAHFGVIVQPWASTSSLALCSRRGELNVMANAACSRRTASATRMGVERD